MQHWRAEPVAVAPGAAPAELRMGACPVNTPMNGAAKRPELESGLRLLCQIAR